MKLPDWPTATESGSGYNGPLSTYAEWHALIIGGYRGLVTLKPWADDYEEVAEEYEDVAKEPWYYKGGYVLGTLLQLIIIYLLLKWGLLLG